MKGGPQTWDELKEKPVGVKRACISLDGTRIAAVFADKTLCIYDTTTGEVILPPFKVDEIPGAVILSRDGNLIALGGQGLRLWNVQTGEEVGSFDIDVYSLAFSPDGTCIAAGCEGSDIIGVDSYNLRVINLESAKMSAHVIPSASEGGTLLKGEVPPSPFKGHVDDVKSVAYSPDGKQIASCSNDYTVRVWDVSTGESRTLKATINRIYCLAFSPDGTQIASGVGLFNLSTGSFTPHAFGIKRVNSLAFLADGRLIASGFANALDDNTCCILDSSIDQSILRLIGHTHNISSFAFISNGKGIMLASEDGTIRVFDVKLLEEREEMDRWQMEWYEPSYRFWVLGPHRERLFWTPLPFRHTRNTLVIGKCLTIDYSNFVHGDEWVKCREPLESRVTTGAQVMEVVGDEGVIPHRNLIMRLILWIYFSLIGYTGEVYTIIYRMMH